MKGGLKIQSVVYTLIGLLLIAGCRSKETGSPSNNIVKGGRVSLTVHVMHHYWAVSSCSVYIKGNVDEFPGYSPSAYDSVKMADPDGYVKFNGIANGSYYVYATGFDIAVNDSVMGYQLVNIDVNPGEYKETALTIFVSE